MVRIIASWTHVTRIRSDKETLMHDVLLICTIYKM